ncbi:MAG TPA: DUF192 domain-containing protein [Geobacteraceae bacterium]|nr:DUF192 domain-containing protein [Geobacteraceae bacterium]
MGIPFIPASAWTRPAQPTIELKINNYSIEAECAETSDSRKQGLMNRHALAENSGMLFVFPRSNRHCMWMHNTRMPLSVAFLAGDGTIINIAEMRPETENGHCAVKAVQYALEMNRGWFAQRGIVAGERIEGIEKAPHGR